MSTTELSARSQPSGKEDSCPFNDRQLAWLSTVMAKGASQPQPSSSKWIRGIVVFVWLAEGTGYRVRWPPSLIVVRSGQILHVHVPFMRRVLYKCVFPFPDG